MFGRTKEKLVAMVLLLAFFPVLIVVYTKYIAPVILPWLIVIAVLAVSWRVIRSRYFDGPR